jgi:hypothetical protein
MPTDHLTKALEFFKDWSNYLLVTTVAALGWIAATDKVVFSSPCLRAVCIGALALSIVFGIFTLALIPVIQEWRVTGDSKTSNYDIDGHFRPGLWGESRLRCRLKWVSFPQHVLFIIGILAFAIGTLWKAPAPPLFAVSSIGQERPLPFAFRPSG